MQRRFLIRLVQSAFPQKITFKLALVFAGFVLILLSLLGMTLTQITQRVLKTTIRNNQEEIVKRAAQEVSVFVQRPIELLGTVAKLIGKIKSDSWGQETMLVEMSLDFPMFEEILSLNKSGMEIASSNPGHPLMNRSKEEAFRSAVQGERYISKIQIGKDHLPHVALAIPYYRLGDVEGVLMADVNLKGMWDIVDGIRIGKSGYAFLISEEGILISHPDKKLIFQNKNFSFLPSFKRISWGETGTAEEKEFLASFSPVQGVLPLVMVVQITTEEAFSLLRQMRFLIWWVVLVSLAMSVLVAFLVARWLVQPVKMLEEWSKKVSLGDFDYRVHPKSSDELGRLFLRFKRMSERLKAARERERLAALGVAASTISHKLKNSIVSLKTFAQLLPQRKSDLAFMQRFERDFAATIEHLEKIFKNLSQVASAREAKMEPVNLFVIFHSIYDAHLETLNRLGIEFHFEVSFDLPEVKGNKEQLRELFVNLVQNAIQAMPKGGSLSLLAGYEPNSQYLEIAIRDGGCGIAPTNLHQIFKPFFTTKHGGMGLGLAICKKIVEDHGGRISVTSMENKGTVFVVHLPVISKKVSIRTPQEFSAVI